MGVFSTGKDSREGRVLTPWQGSLLLNPAPLPVASVLRSDRSAGRRSSSSSWVSLQLNTSQSEWHQQEIKNNQYRVGESDDDEIAFLSCFVFLCFSREQKRLDGRFFGCKYCWDYCILWLCLQLVELPLKKIWYTYTSPLKCVCFLNKKWLWI